MRKRIPFALISIVMLLFVAVSAIATDPNLSAVYAEDGISIDRCRLLLPSGDFLKADLTDGIVCELWTPTDTELIYYGTDDENGTANKTKLTVEEKDKAQRVPNSNEIGNRYEIKVKTTLTLYVLRYRSETDENLNHLGTETFDGNQYFEKKLDGCIPKIAKNTLRTVLQGNRWDISFTAEDPSSDAHYFWAQSGLKRIRVVKKIYPTSDSEAVYETVKDDLTGEDLITEFEGVGEGKPPLKRTSYSASIANVSGDYYVEMTDYVGNRGRYSLLNADESTEPYFESLSMASKYVEDENFNISIRENISNALEAFLQAINEKWTGDRFEAVHQTFLAAMRAANDAKEKGIDCIVNVENGEYLAGTFDAEFSEANYGGKVRYGDTLELRITIAYFDADQYRNSGASVLAKTANASGVLRFNVKLLYNGQEVLFKTPVKIYLGIPNRCRDVSLVYTDSDGNSSVSDMQSGLEWVTFSVGNSGSYSLFFREEKANLAYLWLLLLLIPVGGISMFAVFRYKRKKSGFSKKTARDASDVGAEKQTARNYSGGGAEKQTARNRSEGGAEKPKSGSDGAEAEGKISDHAEAEGGISVHSDEISETKEIENQRDGKTAKPSGAAAGTQAARKNARSVPKKKNGKKKR